MKVKELIEALQNLDRDDAEVILYSGIIEDADEITEVRVYKNTLVSTGSDFSKGLPYVKGDYNRIDNNNPDLVIIGNDIGYGEEDEDEDDDCDCCGGCDNCDCDDD